MRSIAGRLRFQPSRSAPSLPHQAPAERGENTGIPKASKPRKSLRLDPLENGIRRDRTRRALCHCALFRRSGRPYRSALVAGGAHSYFCMYSGLSPDPSSESGGSWNPSASCLCGPAARLVGRFGRGGGAGRGGRRRSPSRPCLLPSRRIVSSIHSTSENGLAPSRRAILPQS